MFKLAMVNERRTKSMFRRGIATCHIGPFYKVFYELSTGPQPGRCKIMFHEDWKGGLLLVRTSFV